jgi:hypothetical protein
LLDPLADTWGQAPAEIDAGPAAAAVAGVNGAEQQQQQQQHDEEGAWESAVPAAVRADTWGSSEPAAGAQEVWQLQQPRRHSVHAANVSAGDHQGDFWGASEAADSDGWGTAAAAADTAAARPATAAGMHKHRQQDHDPEVDDVSRRDEDQQQQRQRQRPWDDSEGGQQRQFDRLAGSSLASVTDAESALDQDGPRNMPPPASADKDQLLSASHAVSLQQQREVAAPTATALPTKPTPAAAAAVRPPPGSAEWTSALSELFSRVDVRWRALLPGDDRVGPFSPAELVGWLVRGAPAPKGVPSADAARVREDPGLVQLCGILAADYNPQKLPGGQARNMLGWRCLAVLCFAVASQLGWWYSAV